MVRSLNAPKMFCAISATKAPTPSTSDKVFAFPAGSIWLTFNARVTWVAGNKASQVPKKAKVSEA